MKQKLLFLITLLLLQFQKANSQISYTDDCYGNFTNWTFTGTIAGHNTYENSNYGITTIIWNTANNRWEINNSMDGLLYHNDTNTAPNPPALGVGNWVDISGGGCTLTDLSGPYTNSTPPAIAPTVTSVSVPANATYKAGQNLNFTVNFSEIVTVIGTPQLDLTVGSTTRQATYTSGSGTSSLVFRYTVQGGDIDANGISIGTLGLNGGSIQAIGGTFANLVLNNVNNTSNIKVDAITPTATIDVAKRTLAIGTTSLVTITFSEAVTGFTNADLTIENGTLSAVSSADLGVTWTATFRPADNIESTSNAITLDNTGVNDAAGNAGTGTTTSNNYEIDTRRPTATIFVANDKLAIGATSLVTITFSEAVTGFTNADLTIDNGTLTAVNSADHGITWTATFTPIPDITDSANKIRLENTGVTDLAGNTGSGATISNNYAIYTKRPTSSIVVASTSLAYGATSLVTIAFSQAVPDFTSADLTVANGTLSGVISADGGITWTATFTPIANSESSSNTITLNNSRVTDLAGNIGTGTTISNNYRIDTRRPTAAIVVARPTLAIGATSLVIITFSEKVVGFTTADLLTPNATLSNLSSSDGGINWTATLTPTNNITESTNLITLNNSGVTDLAGNTVTGTTTSNNFVIDTIRPTATIVVASPTLANGVTSLVTITFSEAVTGFTNDDLTVSNGTLSAVSSTDGDVTWTATFTPTANIESTSNAITLNNSGVTDLAGNTGTGTTTSNNYVIYTAQPIVGSVVVPKALTHTVGNHLDFTIIFSKNVIVTSSGGIPQLAITIGATTVQAPYISGSGSSSLVFRYTVQAGELDTNGITIGNLSLNGGSLKDNFGNNAALTLNNVGNTSRVLVDATIEPTITFSNISKTYGNLDFALLATSNSTGTITYSIISGGTGSATLSGTNNATVTLGNVGTVTLRATQIANGIYRSSSKDIVLSITPATLTGITLADAGFVYDGTAKSLAITGTLPTGTSVTYADNSRTDVGTQKVTATISGANYNDLVLTANLTITPADITGITLADTDFVYDDTAKSLAIAGNLSTGISVTYTNNSRTDVGAQKVTATISGDNYKTLILTADLTITPADITGITFADASFVYDGTAKSLAIAGNLPTGTSVTYTNNSRIDVGTEEVTATISGDNYTTLVLTTDLTITPAQLNIIINSELTKVYGTSDPILSFTASGFKGLDTASLLNGKLDRIAGENVGNYAINSGDLNAGANYDIHFTGMNFSITPADLAIVIKNQTKVYGETDAQLTYTATGLVNGDQPTILSGTLQREQGENVGEYVIHQGNLEAGFNYNLNFKESIYTITKANQTITWNQNLELGCNDTSTISLTATADSGLPITYTLDNTSLGTITESELTISGSGSTTITAVQNGNQNYNAATMVSQPFENSQSGLIKQQWDDVLLFDNNNNNYVAWQWYKNGSAISGATQQYYNEKQTLNGSYYVIATDKNNNIVKSCPIELTGKAFTKQLKIYPNPVKPNAEFTFDCDFSEAELNNAEITVFDLSGRLLQTIKTVKTKNQMTAPAQTAIFIIVLKLSNGRIQTSNLLVK